MISTIKLLYKTIKHKLITGSSRSTTTVVQTVCVYVIDNRSSIVIILTTSYCIDIYITILLLDINVQYFIQQHDKVDYKC